MTYGPNTAQIITLPVPSPGRFAAIVNQFREGRLEADVRQILEKAKREYEAASGSIK